MDGDFIAWMNFLLAGAGGGGLVGLAQWWVDRQDRKARLRMANVLDAIAQTYGCLNRIVALTPAHRAFVLRCSNGGDVPAVGREQYATVIYETYEAPFSSRKDTWDQRGLDESYLHLLVQVKNSQWGMWVPTADLPVGSILRDAYERDGVVTSFLAPLHTAPGEFFYLAVNFSEKFTPGASFRDRVLADLSVMRALFKDYGPIRWKP